MASHDYTVTVADDATHDLAVAAALDAGYDGPTAWLADILQAAVRSTAQRQAMAAVAADGDAAADNVTMG